MELNMKTRIATALSVVGVLGAGSAAALVNTQILDGGPAESAASAAVLPPASTVDVSIPDVPDEARAPETSVDTIVTTPATSEPQPTATTEPVAPPAPAPSEFLTAFNVGAAGVVTVDVIDGQLVLVKAEAKAGWDVTKTEQHDAENEVEVDFSSGTVSVEFEAMFIDGQIVPKVTSKSIGGNTAPAGTVPGDATSTTIAGSGHDDHESDHDDHESDHDEEDERDEDESDHDEEDERDDD
jgi:hypothetical protein